METFTSATWWKLVKITAEKSIGLATPDLSQFMSELITLPALSVAVEKCSQLLADTYEIEKVFWRREDDKACEVQHDTEGKT